MDIKEVAKKVIEGANVEEVTSTLDDKSKGDVWKEIAIQRKKIADDELAIIEARKQERKRVEADLEGTKTQITTDVRTQMRGEQIDIAMTIAEQRLQSKGIKLTPEEMAKLKEGFKPFDSGKFDATLIVGDILKAYAATNAERLIDFASQSASGARSAADFTSGGASGGSAGSGTQTDPAMTPTVRAAMQASAKFGVPLSREQAERAEKVGTDWKIISATRPPKNS